MNITVHSPLVISAREQTEDAEAIRRFLCDLLTDIVSDAERTVRAALESAKGAAMDSGYALEIPALAEPMGMSFGITDVTGHIGRKWKPGAKRGNADRGL